MQKKKLLIFGAVGLILFTVICVFIIVFPYINVEQSFVRYYDNLESPIDKSKKMGWNTAIKDTEYKIVMTEFGITKAKYTFVGKFMDYKIYDADVFELTRNSIFDMSWNVKELSSNTVENKSFDQVVDLAKKKDIGMINREILDHDSGNDCVLVEGGVGKYNCWKRFEDPTYDKSITSYRTLSPEEEKKDQEEIAAAFKRMKELEPAPTPSPWEEKEYQDYMKMADDKIHKGNATPAEIEKMYGELITIVKKYVMPNEYEMKYFQEFFHVDANGKYIAPSPTPTPEGN